MGLTTKSRFPTFQGPTQALVPTPTFSGLLTSDPADSINPYTSTGPGTGGAGITYDENQAISAGAVDWTEWSAKVQYSTAPGTGWLMEMDNPDLSWNNWIDKSQHTTAPGTGWLMEMDDPTITWIEWNNA